RRDELAQAVAQLTLAQRGRGRIVALIGEAGQGKSRLMAELARIAGEQGVPAYGGECPSFGANAGYQVWRPIWRGLFGIGLEDCHWLDALSHDLLEVLGRASANLPVLIAMTYRPPQADRLQSPRVSLLSHFTGISLTELAPDDIAQLIRQRLRAHAGEQVTIS